MRRLPSCFLRLPSQAVKEPPGQLARFVGHRLARRCVEARGPGQPHTDHLPNARGLPVGSLRSMLAPCWFQAANVNLPRAGRGHPRPWVRRGW